ncbi:MAG: formylglycine-generating enzyme family protein [Xenococcus sp. MO_188.B8]|nr:formylglycine-generating enzyme family protein [Xenococcus sp. MO_188.B8]
MVLIPSGEFMMGASETELDSRDSERPQHKVRVPTFFMGKYPVTQMQWRVVAAMPQVNRELQPDPSLLKGDKRPVEQVNWYQAVEFCDRISQHTGRKYRLPSEAEWEYACRAGTTTPFHFGETITTDFANYNGNYTYGEGPKGEYREETKPVDQFGIANDFGLCDMHGNVWEWCLDHWHNNYQNAPTDGSAWVSGGKSSRRVFRGGSLYNGPGNCRSASRDNDLPEQDRSNIGFRVVCMVPETL